MKCDKLTKVGYVAWEHPEYICSDSLYLKRNK